MTDRMVIGCMTGTSLDGVDAAAIDVSGEGLEMRARFVCGVSGGLGSARQPLREMTLGGVVDIERFLAARRDYADAVADAVELVAHETGRRPTLVAIHGQTVFHRPPLSWQVVEPWNVARRLACPVVTDLRGADLAAGGQGAPITPLADWVLFRDGSADRAIVNLGGFCNVTLLPSGGRPESVRGFDICACNHVLDTAARLALGAPFDDAGQAARRGRADPDAVDEFAQSLSAQSRQGRSLGSGDEADAMVEDWRGRLSADDLCATAADAVGRTIGAVLREHLAADAEVFLSGGGARNAALSESITRAAGTAVRPLDDTGIPATYREAACMGVLGALAGDGVSVTLPGVTGAREPIPLGGSWANVRVRWNR